jgi:threonylcarbamoyladenosine tRNA methylthiotransferase MtaB
MTTFSIATFGCKVNQFESEALTDSLLRKGYQLVPFDEGGDLSIINTCTVTHRADFQSRQAVRRVHRANPGALIIATGCYSQVDPQAFLKMEEVQYLVGNAEKSQIPDLLPLMEKGDFPKIQVTDIREQKGFVEVPIHTFHHHTRAFLKIQDGCDAFCSYCIVPHARGRSRSLPPERVLENLRELKRKGFQEVVLTGIHLGAYGLDLVPPFPFVKLLERLEKEETPQRIRLSSMEPGDFSEDLLSFLTRSTKICPHLHIPIQSGDDEILQKMNREYHRSFLTNLLQELQQNIPMLSLGADVIVGFPGETDEQFNHTYEWIDSLPLSYLHVFPFSRRKGTPAYHFPDRVDERKIRQRAEAMRELGMKKRHAFYRRFLHQTLQVLVEGRKEKATGKWKGLSRNYIPVLLDGEGLEDDHWMNQEWTVLATDWTGQEVRGRIVER